MFELKTLPYDEGYVEVRKLLQEKPDLDTFDDLGLQDLARTLKLAPFSIPGRIHVKDARPHTLITEEMATTAVAGPRVEEPREYTLQEEHDNFVQHVAGLVDYWSGPLVAREGKSYREHLNHCVGGIAHSILVALQGGSGSMPGYYLIPRGTEEDRQWSIEHNRNYHRVSEDLDKDERYHDVLSVGYAQSEMFDRLRSLRSKYTGPTE